MTTSAVHYGSLAFPRAAKELVDGALAYLRRDAVERDVIRRVEHSPVPHRITINHHGDDAYLPWKHTVRWDPTSAMRTTHHHGRQSPALCLGHELDHAAIDDRTFERLVDVPNRRFDNAEERRVILGSERHAARTLHESTRSDHRGRLYRVANPIDRR